MITWDEKKRRQVIKDHGIDFDKIADIFADPFAIDAADQEQAELEERWLPEHLNTGWWWLFTLSRQ